MNRRIYTSARGKKIDLGDVMLKNEDVRAVGNMPVNARGDIIDSNNKTVVPRNKNVAKHYSKQTNVVDEPVFATKAEARAAKAKTVENIESAAEQTPAPIAESKVQYQVSEKTIETESIVQQAADEMAEEVEKVEKVEETESTDQQEDKPTGLAAAIAKSRKVTQTKTTPPSKKKKNMRL